MKDTLTIDLRHKRAAALTSFIVHTVSKYICDCDRMRKPMRDLHDELFAEFHKTGVEIVSDYDREAAGLPPRGPEGWTIEELIALEKRRLELLRAPISMIFPHKKEASDEPQPVPWPLSQGGNTLDQDEAPSGQKG